MQILFEPCIKGNANNGRSPTSCPFLVIAVVNEEATGCINEKARGAIDVAAISAIIASKHSLPCFILFHFLLFQYTIN